MTEAIRIQIIDRHSKQILDARTWGNFDALVALLPPGGALRYKEPFKRWRYAIGTGRGYHQVKSNNQLTEAFRLAGFFDAYEQNALT